MLLLLISGVYAATTSSHGQLNIVSFLEVCLKVFLVGGFCEFNLRLTVSAALCL